ncbi:hypothetical protein KJ966_28705 [bacterium]|nr:hypothetical protein [bacterium]
MIADALETKVTDLLVEYSTIGDMIVELAEGKEIVFWVREYFSEPRSGCWCHGFTE